MQDMRFIATLGMVFGFAVATVAHAGGELEIAVESTDVPIAAGAFADVQLTVLNHTAETMSGLVLRIGPSYRYELLSGADCGPLVPETMTPDHLRSALAPIAPDGELSCVIRVHRDAGMAESPATGWSVYSGADLGVPSDGKIMRFGTFADIRLSATLMSRSVSDAGIHSVVRATAHNASVIALTIESTLEPCLVARPQRVIAGSCMLTGNVCGLGARDFLRWPSLAPGATAQCDLESDVGLSVDTWSPEFFVDEASASTTGEYVHPSLGEVPRIAFPVTHARIELDQAGIGGTWASAATPAQGFVLDVSPDFHGEGRALLFGGWFTYGGEAGSAQRWFTLQGEIGGIESEVGLYYSEGGTFDATQPATTTRIGSAKVRFADCNHGQIRYLGDPPYEHGLSFGTIPITRLLPNAGCSADGNPGASAPPQSALAGTWADAANSAQGLVVDIDPEQRVLFAGWFTYPASGTDPQRWYTLQGTLDASAPAGTGIGLYESTGGAFNGPAPATTRRVGEVDIELLTCTSASMSYRFTAGENAGLAGTLDLSRLGAAPASCAP